ncbi:1-deoxy-D-xylulose-5-phosphate synthase N-terminal domain-containing protein [Candidatus Pelagibacter bacterium nBUS_33]|uniref:1-deoxy-D-xylulose-5-phosphate synthase N-terminal domain-containing protein n=1 Tax=Candidatus Pelagibacter bacterium nBUS_33 TaxID=3374193 RepID=UPI003EB7D889
MNYKYIPLSSIKKIYKINKISFLTRLELISQILRLNILYSIQLAGSGHLGSSLSALDIFLCCSEYLKNKKGNFFSSKGHDVPALYNVMAIYKKLDFKKIHMLRKLNGIPGHPDIRTKNILFNTGSLGMGISKINGLSFANMFSKEKEKNIVILGDGELQEGQNWEAFMFLQNNKNISPLIIVDSNKIQSDTWVNKVKNYSKLKNKIKSFNLNFKEINGHNKSQIFRSIESHFKKNNGATIILANTIKGKGFSFTEASNFNKLMNFYPFHSGSLPENLYEKATEEILNKIHKFCKLKKISPPIIKNYKLVKKKTNLKSLNLVESYSKELSKFVKKNKKAIVLDADLTKDAGSSEVMLKLPKQFIEFGIAEQDMVSFGSGLAAKKFLPIFHSFSCFLSTRSQEQIFNFCSENRKGIFLGALSGLIPSGPGHSHQMIRDIPIIGSMPNMIMLEIYSRQMISQFFNYQKKIKKSLFVKLNNSLLIEKNFKSLKLPKLGNLLKVISTEKSEKIIICQGADILNQALKIKNQIINMKNTSLYSAVWLNNLNKKEILNLNKKKVLVFQSSTNFGSFGSFLSDKILSNGCKLKKFKAVSIENLPECGQNDEVLDYHKLSSSKMLKEIKNF